MSASSPHPTSITETCGFDQIGKCLRRGDEEAAYAGEYD
eukprot:CAMPEP_0201677310 /NCGR_PEP_ID=MMETSP0494-20130426/43850_1 /ASSEMBLY_ACC=CAM_ASM_000839 /TAXON_ID=420259 /ORGANISM="Thalassiosira gravida, Strain GMp14c1" /LENGTH=38 /DNA_ID= /DNA_START= /DNA_END= /DNA_ORIENTATION=